MKIKKKIKNTVYNLGGFILLGSRFDKRMKLKHEDQRQATNKTSGNHLLYPPGDDLRITDLRILVWDTKLLIFAAGLRLLDTQRLKHTMGSNRQTGKNKSLDWHGVDSDYRQLLGVLPF